MVKPLTPSCAKWCSSTMSNVTSFRNVGKLNVTSLANDLIVLSPKR